MKKVNKMLNRRFFFYSVVSLLCDDDDDIYIFEIVRESTLSAGHHHNHIELELDIRVLLSGQERENGRLKRVLFLSHHIHINFFMIFSVKKSLPV